MAPFFKSKISQTLTSRTVHSDIEASKNRPGTTHWSVQLVYQFICRHYIAEL